MSSAPRGVGPRPGDRAAAGLILAGGALRFWHLDLRSLWFDETQGLFRAAHAGIAQVWAAPPLVEPPLYYWLLHGWLAMGRSDASVRALSALLGTVALALAWQVYRRVLPRPVAVAALALAACAPFQILYAQQARPYMLRECFELGALLAVLAGSWGWAALWAGLAGASHTLALLWLPCLGIVALLAGPTVRPRPWRRLAVAALAAAAPAVLFALVRREVIAHVNAVAPRAVAFNAFLAGSTQLFGAGAWIPRPLAEPVFWLFAGLTAAGLAVSVLRGRGSPTREAAVLSACGVLLPLALFAAHAAGLVYLPKPRYAITAQLFLLAACARGIALAPSPRMRAALLAALLFADAASLAGYFRGGAPVLDLPPCIKPFREAATLLAGRLKAGDAVVSVEFETLVPLRWYLGDAVPQWCPYADPRSTDAERMALGQPRPIAAIAPTARRMWVVVAPVIWTATTGLPLEPAAELARVAVRRERMELPGLAIERWDPRP